MIVVMAIIVLMFGAIMALQRDVFVLGGMFQSTFAAHGEAERAFRQMSAEIRSLQPSAQGAYPIEKAEADEFIFFRDIQGDGLIERVRYAMEGDTVIKGVTAPSGEPVTYDLLNEKTSVLVRNISSDTEPLFSYHGESGPLSDPVILEAIRSVTITIDINRDHVSSGQPIVLTTHVTPRNLR